MMIQKRKKEDDDKREMGKIEKGRKIRIKRKGKKMTVKERREANKDKRDIGIK